MLTSDKGKNNRSHNPLAYCYENLIPKNARLRKRQDSYQHTVSNKRSVRKPAHFAAWKITATNADKPDVVCFFLAHSFNYTLFSLFALIELVSTTIIFVEVKCSDEGGEVWRRRVCHNGGLPSPDLKPLRRYDIVSCAGDRRGSAPAPAF